MGRTHTRPLDGCLLARHSPAVPGCAFRFVGHWVLRACGWTIVLGSIQGSPEAPPVTRCWGQALSSLLPRQGASSPSRSSSELCGFGVEAARRGRGSGRSRVARFGLALVERSPDSGSHFRGE